MIRTMIFRLSIHSQLRKEVAEGRLTKLEARRLTKAVTHKVAAQLLQDVARKSGSYPVMESIVQFVIENWAEILKAILIIASLIGDENE